MVQHERLQCGDLSSQQMFWHTVLIVNLLTEKYISTEIKFLIYCFPKTEIKKVVLVPSAITTHNL